MIELLIRLLIALCSVADSKVCGVRLINKTGVNLAIFIKPEQATFKKIVKTGYHSELAERETKNAMFECISEEGSARVTVAVILNGKQQKYPGRHRVFNNYTYNVEYTNPQTIKLRLAQGLEAGKVLTLHELKLKIKEIREQQLDNRKTLEHLKELVRIAEQTSKKTEPSKKLSTIAVRPSVLALTNKNAVLIDRKGHGHSVTFDFAGHAIQDACSVKLDNRMFILGGTPKRWITSETVQAGGSARRISEVVNCGLKSVGNLDFDFAAGACVVTNETLVLCFDYNHGKVCRRGSSVIGPFDVIEDTSFIHKYSSIASSEENVFVVGSSNPYHAESELLNKKNWTWRVTTTYPYDSDNYYGPIIYHEPNFYLFDDHNGGTSSKGRTSIIAAFNEKTETWSKVGTMARARSGHGVIPFENYYLIVDGYGQKPTEKCTLSGVSMNCVSSKRRLTDLGLGLFPKMFIVPNNFCFEPAT